MKWEYKIVESKYPDLEILAALLSKYGTQGWELVHINGGVVFIFKRPIP